MVMRNRGKFVLIDEKQQVCQCVYCNEEFICRNGADGMSHACQYGPLEIDPAIFKIDPTTVPTGIIPPPDSTIARSALEAPSAIRRLTNFTGSAIIHALNGSPTCTQEEIDARLTICRKCEFFQPIDDKKQSGMCMHPSCGCNLNREQKYLNKLAWADQECPIKRWRKIEKK